MYSMEWKYYAPVENRKYRGSRRYVPKLIEEKITEFISHFKYIFSDINNKTIRVNLINMETVAMCLMVLHSILFMPSERLQMLIGS